MRIALLSDIHGNLEAFEAVLAHVERLQPDRLALLGDLVGYGADPVAVVSIARALADAGAIVLKGNHDAAVEDQAPDMNQHALEAIRWTRAQLGPAQRAFLAELPLTATLDDLLLVHAAANQPASWPYVTNARAAERSLGATSARVVVAGHTHVPALHALQPNGVAVSHTPVAGTAIPLARHRRWHAILGAVGQPRDGDPAAAYALFDTGQGAITFHRVGYDHARAAAKVLAAGLPHALAHRLGQGR
jgi:diadenosine tetraphosphatase ApaH/serine/threonine PP2A family protein phosphatase